MQTRLLPCQNCCRNQFLKLGKKVRTAAYKDIYQVPQRVLTLDDLIFSVLLQTNQLWRVVQSWPLSKSRIRMLANKNAFVFILMTRSLTCGWVQVQNSSSWGRRWKTSVRRVKWFGTWRWRRDRWSPSRLSSWPGLTCATSSPTTAT